MTDRDELTKLAAQVLAVLDAQQTYFKTKAPARLIESKQMERTLRKACEAILNPKAAPQPGLFDEENVT